VLTGEDKPNFTILIYPVISGTMWSGRPQQGTIEALLGKWRTDVDVANISCDLLVTEQTPPALLLHSDDDILATTANSTLYYKALKHHGVKASMHIYPSGGHGWFGRDKWEYRKQWLEAIKEWVQLL
jgi:acetyl esterase/lipase